MQIAKLFIDSDVIKKINKIHSAIELDEIFVYIVKLFIVVKVVLNGT